MDRQERRRNELELWIDRNELRRNQRRRNELNMGQKVSVSGINPACTCGSVLDYGEGKWYRCLAKVVLNYGQTGTAQKRKQIDADQGK